MRSHDYLVTEPVGYHKASPHKRRPGKQSNLRKPRTSGAATVSMPNRIPQGACVSYRLDDAGKPTQIKLFRASQAQRAERKRTQVTQAKVQPDVVRYAFIGNTGGQYD